MPKPALNDIENLFEKLVLPFYQLERDLPLPIDNHRNETDAEHSWSLALLACALAPHIDPKLDIGQVCQFAIVHDLVEVYAGDVSVWAANEQHQAKKANEAKALKKLEQSFAKFPWVIETVRRYEAKDSDEAQFVNSIDKFAALLVLYKDKGFYYHRGKITKARFEKQFAPHRKKAHVHAGAANYYEKIRQAFDAHPEYFYRAKP